MKMWHFQDDRHESLAWLKIYIKHATISLRIVSNNYSSCQKSLSSLIQVLSLQAKDRLKFVTGSNSITCSIIRVFVNLFLCILKKKKKESMKIFMAIFIFTKLMSLWVRLENILDFQYLFRMMNACIMNHRV